MGPQPEMSDVAQPIENDTNGTTVTKDDDVEEKAEEVEEDNDDDKAKDKSVRKRKVGYSFGH